MLYDFRDLTGNISSKWHNTWCYIVGYTALLISLTKVFYTINHNLLMIFNRSILVPCQQHQRWTLKISRPLKSLRKPITPEVTPKSTSGSIFDQLKSLMGAPIDKNCTGRALLKIIIDEFHILRIFCEKRWETHISTKIKTELPWYQHYCHWWDQRLSLCRLLRRRSKKTPKLRVTGLCEGNSPVTG